MTLWAVLAAPLLLGSDLAQLDALTLDLLTNEEVLAVNQDPLGKQGRRVKGDEDGPRGLGPRARGRHAGGGPLQPRGRGGARRAALRRPRPRPGQQAVRDLWAKKDLGRLLRGLGRRSSPATALGSSGSARQKGTSMTRSGLAALSLPVLAAAAPVARSVSGELKQWHKVTLTLDGPFARERDTRPNPFLDYRLTVRFAHESGPPRYDVPGYFAADGNAGETSAEEGTKWRAHLSPDKAGRWTWRASFVKGPARRRRSDGSRSRRWPAWTGPRGPSPSSPPTRRAATSGPTGGCSTSAATTCGSPGRASTSSRPEPDAPETLLGYADFDGTVARKPNVPLKTWAPHVRDWRPGDPTWKGGKGKGLIGALNYLAGRGMNAFSFLTYNAGGDGDNVWPFVERDLKLHYDCSKLDQWQVVFDHAQSLGLYLHFKTQETEIDDQRLSHERTPGAVPEALDGGAVGVERRLYYRELVARFGHELALNWNLGEENTQTPEEQRAMAAAFRELDPYGHLVVIHTHPGDQDLVYTPLLGEGSALTGASLQNHWDVAHQRVLKWRRESAQAGKPWVVANDEQGDAAPRSAAGPRLRGLLRQGEGEGRPRVRPPRRPPPHAVGHADGGRRGRRVLLRLLAAPERPPRRGLAQPRALVGLRARRARLLPRRAHPVRGDGARRRPGRQRRRGQLPLRPSRSGARSTSSTCRRAARPSSTSPGPPAASRWPGSTRGRAARSRRARCARSRAGRECRSAPRPRTRPTTGWRSCAAGRRIRPMRTALRIATSALAAALPAAPALAAPPARPNVVFILADDLGYGDLGAYGQKLIRTPHLDRLAAEGLRFTDFYAGSTVCAPSRAVLMTGRHTGHASVRGNAGGGALSIQALRQGERTLAHLFQDAGYATALFGKWGLGETGSPGHPNRMGFDAFFGYLNQRHAHNYYPSFLFRDEARVPLRNVPEKEDEEGAGWARTRVEYSHDVIVDAALRWVDENRAKPFFLYLAVTLPHANNEAKAGTGDGQEVPDYGEYAREPWPNPDKGQAAMISRLDRDVGRLLAKLEELGIASRHARPLLVRQRPPPGGRERPRAVRRERAPPRPEARAPRGRDPGAR